MSPSSELEPAGATVDLHGDLYSLESVQLAMAAFAHLGRLELVSAPPYHRVRVLVAGGMPPRQLAAELAQYALAMAAAAFAPQAGAR